MRWNMNTLPINTMINDTVQQPAITAYHIEQFLKSQHVKLEKQEVHTLKKCSDHCVEMILETIGSAHSESR